MPLRQKRALGMKKNENTLKGSRIPILKKKKGYFYKKNSLIIISL